MPDIEDDHLGEKVVDNEKSDGEKYAEEEIKKILHVNFRMPDIEDDHLGAETELTKWFKQVGDPITAGDSLCEIETPEVIFSLDSEDEGYLAKIDTPAGS